MKIILTQSIDRVGNAGDIINVKAGFGRNDFGDEITAKVKLKVNAE